MNRKLYPLILVILCLLASPLAAQDFKLNKPKGRQQKRLAKFIKKQQADPVFKDTIIPDIWRNESAVILAQKKRFVLDKRAFTPTLRYYYYYRTRTKLLDQAALERYSTFYFKKGDFFRITVVKPNGKSYEVNLKQAVALETTIGTGKKKRRKKKINLNNNRKIAIPNLEVGDIIDFVTADHSTNMYSAWGYWPALLIPPFIFAAPVYLGYALSNPPYVLGFSTTTEPLAREYPLKTYKLEFDLHPKFYLNFKALHTDASLETYAKKSKSSKSFGNLYVFEETMINRMKDEYFSYPVIDFPTVKYQLQAMNNKAVKQHASLFSKNKIMTGSFNTSDLQKYSSYMWRSYKKEYRHSMLRYVYKKNKDIRRISDPEEFVRKFFYRYKDITLGLEIARGADPAMVRLNNEEFVMYFASLLRKKNIPFELMMAIPRDKGNLSDLAYSEELVWGIKLDGFDNIITELTPFSNISDMDYRFYGADIYTIMPSRNWKNVVVNDENIDVPLNQSNQEIVRIDARLELDSNLVAVKRQVEATGYLRRSYQQTALVRSDFTRSLFRIKFKRRHKLKIDFVSPYYYTFSSRRKLKAENERLKASLQKQDEQRRLKQMKREVEQSYPLHHYTSFSLKQDGLSMDSLNLVFQDEFKLKGMIGPSGNDRYVVEIGQFFPGNLEIRDEEDKSRASDIHFDFPYKRTYKIVVEIPSGYRVDNLSQLNQQIDNETGAFSVKATLSANILTLDIVKEVKGLTHAKSQWEQVLAVFNSAAEFQFKKVVLKKG